MKLLYGTTNQAKLESMKRVTKILGLEIFGLNELKEMPEFANVVFPEIDETGSNPLENATLNGFLEKICRKIYLINNKWRSAPST